MVHRPSHRTSDGRRRVGVRRARRAVVGGMRSDARARHARTGHARTGRVVALLFFSFCTSTSTCTVELEVLQHTKLCIYVQGGNVHSVM